MPGSAAPTEPGLARAAAQRRGDHRGGLGEPVALVHRDAGALGERGGELGRDRRGPGQHEPDPAQAVGEVGDRQPVREHRRRDRDDGDRLVLDDGQRALHVEAVDEDQPAALAQHLAEHGVEPVDVEQRQHAEDDVVALDHRRVHRGGLLDVGRQRPVGEHRRARAARRTAGVEEDGQRLGVRGGRRLHRGRDEQVGVGRLPRQGGRADHDDPRDGGPAAELLVGAHEGVLDPGDRLPHRRDGAAVGDDQTRAAVGDHPDHLAGGRAGVHRDRHQPGAQRTEVRR